VQGSDGNFYGTTASGGAFTDQNGEGFGTVFKMTLDGTITTLYSFSGPDGKYPQGPGLAQDSDGNFYGAAYPGGPDSFGTIFKITPDGGLTTVYGSAARMGRFLIAQWSERTGISTEWHQRVASVLTARIHRVTGLYSE